MAVVGAKGAGQFPISGPDVGVVPGRPKLVCDEVRVTLTIFS